jgi:hypothetical protein
MRSLIFCLLGAFALCSAVRAEDYTYADLLAMRTDLERLAVLPQPGERCAQFSSYDRRSHYVAATGTYQNWDANGDGRGMVRREGNHWVMAEMTGPGCIWRIWSARPGDGHVKVYPDGADEPAIDMPFRNYFDGEHEPFTDPEFVYEAAKGWNCYVPIPYRKSCKVTADEGWGDYYHITYSTFPDGTTVPSGTGDAGPVPAGKTEREQETLSRTVTIPPGEAVTIAELTGLRAITSIGLALPPGMSENTERELRTLALMINWDGEQRPAVWAPLGDFFASAPDISAVYSLPLMVRPPRAAVPEEDASQARGGFAESRWYMPFARRAVIRVSNDGPSAATVLIAITHTPLMRPIEELGRFHAKWHRDAFLPEETGRAIDWTLLSTKGHGRFVGTMLHVWNPRGGWWGEGDEKLFVDGEKFPSTFGTGSEDYFGYAWGDPTLFSRPFHGQTHNDGWNRGHVSLYRWHIADNVPFQKSFEASIEKYFPNERGTLYAATVYWYLEPGGEDPYGPLPVAELVGYDLPSEPFREPGALEGEGLEVLRRTGGQVIGQDMYPFGEGWSGDNHLWWINARPGDELVLAVPVAEDGTYAVSAQFTKAHDYGIVSLGLDGEPLGGPIDLYNPAVVRTGAVDLGERRLTAGRHELTVRIEGANEAALKRYMFALDWIKLTPK